MHEAITAATLLCCIAICGRLLTYKPHMGARHRPAAAWLAWALVVATGGQALTLVMFGGPHAPDHVSAPLFQLLLLVALTVAIYRARGNAACLLPEE